MTMQAVEHLVDIVIDIETDSTSFVVSDVSDEDEEPAREHATLCIAPPCGLKMPARTEPPIPWIMRLTPPAKA